MNSCNNKITAQKQLMNELSYKIYESKLKGSNNQCQKERCHPSQNNFLVSDLKQAKIFCLCSAQWHLNSASNPHIISLVRSNSTPIYNEFEISSDECAAVFHGLKVTDCTRQPIFSDLECSNGSVSFTSHFLTHWNILQRDHETN